MLNVFDQLGIKFLLDYSRGNVFISRCMLENCFIFIFLDLRVRFFFINKLLLDEYNSIVSDIEHLSID